MEYVKINSLWKREGWYFDQEKKKSPNYQKGRQSFIVGDYACPEFANIKTWRVSEKVDGTNIRVTILPWADNCYTVSFAGRTSKAVIQPELFEYLNAAFSTEVINSAFGKLDSYPADEIILYGEGYGPKIQAAGANYRDTVGFILFDIVKGKNNWLDRESVRQYADKLSIPVVPDLGIMTEDAIVDFIKSKPVSLCSVKQQTLEGVVCRSDPTVYFKHGAPVMFKLKCKDFV